MERVRRAIIEANEYEKENRPNAAYYKNLEAFFETLKVIRLEVLAAAPYSAFLTTRSSALKTSPNPTAVTKMFAQASETLSAVERLIESVVEIDPRLAEALAIETATVTSRLSSDPPILSPSTMFRSSPETLSLDAADTPTRPPPDPHKLVPMLPAGKLLADLFGIQYNVAIVFGHADSLRRESGKNKANALYLGELRAIMDDLQKLSCQRDGIDHVMYQSLQIKHFTQIPLKAVADQLTLLDGMLFTRIVHLPRELEFAGWMGKERLLRAPGISLHREFAGFVSHWVAWELLVNSTTEEERIDKLIHFVGLSEMLADRSSYHMLLAIIRGLSCEPILRLASSSRVSLFQELPKRTLITWDRLQGLVLDSAKQRALLAKAPSGCLPAYDAAYLSELMYIDPQFQCLSKIANASKESSIPQHRFQKYVVEMEKLRFGAQTVISTVPAHPSIQHYLVSRPFWSMQQLLNFSRHLEPQGCPADDYPVRLFHRRYLDDPESLFRPKNADPHTALTISRHPSEDIQLERLSLGEEPRSPDSLLGSLTRLEDPVEAVARRESQLAFGRC